jgi:hypothetical protein
MKSRTFMILGLALALPACTLYAQHQNDGPPGGGPPGGGPGRGHRPPPMPLIMALDTNHDGVISADEIANAAAALLTLDKNGDGQLTKDEYLPPRPPRGQTNDGVGPQHDGPPPGDAQKDGSGQNHPKRPVPPIVAALDANGDGVISADEIANAPAALLKLDKNGDGQLTMDELMGPRPPRGEGGPGPDGSGDGQRPPPPDQNN